MFIPSWFVLLFGFAAMLLSLFIYLCIMLVIVYIKKDTSIGNFSWGGGCLLLTLVSLFVFGHYHPRQILVTMLITIWCSRLAYYVWARYKKGADPRYVDWLHRWRNPFVGFLFSFGWIVILNGLFSLVMSLPAVAINITAIQPTFGWFDFLGILVWLTGFIIESVSDMQLHAFMSDPENKGHLCTQGLWRYSRHPNYFGEMCMWWGLFLIACSIPLGMYTFITPCAITFTLLFVTGIPWNEKAISTNPEYPEYKRRTSILIPWFVKK
ncbi:MAG: DUF1295 domain-containing protein [Candidatus Babeliales bacterium]|nr:DUF1295 domain-containing protein [Candidatus Babeliales bacterium]